MENLISWQTPSLGPPLFYNHLLLISDFIICQSLYCLVLEKKKTQILSGWEGSSNSVMMVDSAWNNRSSVILEGVVTG